MDKGLHQEIPQMFEGDIDEDDFPGFPASGMEEHCTIKKKTEI